MRVDQAGHDGLVLCGNAFDVRPAVGEGIGVGNDGGDRAVADQPRSLVGSWGVTDSVDDGRPRSGLFAVAGIPPDSKSVGPVAVPDLGQALVTSGVGHAERRPPSTSGPSGDPVGGGQVNNGFGDFPSVVPMRPSACAAARSFSRAFASSPVPRPARSLISVYTPPGRIQWPALHLDRVRLRVPGEVSVRPGGGVRRSAGKARCVCTDPKKTIDPAGVTQGQGLAGKSITGPTTFVEQVEHLRSSMSDRLLRYMFPAALTRGVDSPPPLGQRARHQIPAIVAVGDIGTDRRSNGRRVRRRPH